MHFDDDQILTYIDNIVLERYISRSLWEYGKITLRKFLDYKLNRQF